jgi:hypothetical protein
MPVTSVSLSGCSFSPGWIDSLQVQCLNDIPEIQDYSANNVNVTANCE